MLPPAEIILLLRVYERVCLYRGEKACKITTFF